MSETKQGRVGIHPYVGGTTSNLIASVLKNGGVDVEHLPTLAATLLGTVLTSPLRGAESLLYGRSIANAPLAADPIFILGHWRSGTTHLHNIISRDERFGYLTTLQAFFPTSSVLLSKSATIKHWVGRLLPEKRMMDNMAMHLDLPQEEEFSVSCITTSAHHCNHFPRTIRDSFDKYVFFDIDEAHKARWKRAYTSVIKKASFMAGGKRLVLKNPYNTARIKTLLEIFPNAKFIHIYRNPYNVYVSTLHDFIKEAEEMALQRFSADDFAELTFELYVKFMQAYFDSRDLVPKGNLSEIAYEALENDPVGEIARLYRELGLEFSPTARRQIGSYLDSIKDYKKNKYTYHEELVEKIESRWGWFISELKYDRPKDVAITNEATWTCQMDH